MSSFNLDLFTKISSCFAVLCLQEKKMSGRVVCACVAVLPTPQRYKWNFMRKITKGKAPERKKSVKIQPFTKSVVRSSAGFTRDSRRTQFTL